MGRVWQPYESHLPYLLQLKIDFNLAGMAWLRLSAGRFRRARAGQGGAAAAGMVCRGPLHASYPKQ